MTYFIRLPNKGLLYVKGPIPALHSIIDVRGKEHTVVKITYVLSHQVNNEYETINIILDVI